MVVVENIAPAFTVKFVVKSVSAILITTLGELAITTLPHCAFGIVALTFVPTVKSVMPVTVPNVGNTPPFNIIAFLPDAGATISNFPANEFPAGMFKVIAAVPSPKITFDAESETVQWASTDPGIVFLII